MKTNALLVPSVLLTLDACGGLGPILGKILEFPGVLGPVAWKSAAAICLCTRLVCAVLALARSAVWDGRFVAFVAFHAALWVTKIFLFAAVISGHAK